MQARTAGAREGRQLAPRAALDFCCAGPRSHPRAAAVAMA
eukprot:CAMPEP_0119261728 /NCGR_PEP_ID=MMETSP1329-20130426/1685_1 /TAXON_ID=114041 /ORGANISM="Genus nov. species nov., Strain RCC1024" /LENGTH=39 /DNA_ID= /DNA_START= /DNA_END= /DNA_ORIENTATION=